MHAATQQLRAVQQRALSGSVTNALMEELEALRVSAKEAVSKRDEAQQEIDTLKSELAGLFCIMNMYLFL